GGVDLLPAYHEGVVAAELTLDGGERLPEARRHVGVGEVEERLVAVRFGEVHLGLPSARPRGVRRPAGRVYAGAAGPGARNRTAPAARSRGSAAARPGGGCSSRTSGPRTARRGAAGVRRRRAGPAGAAARRRASARRRP